MWNETGFYKKKFKIINTEGSRWNRCKLKAFVVRKNKKKKIKKKNRRTGPHNQHWMALRGMLGDGRQLTPSMGKRQNHQLFSFRINILFLFLFFFVTSQLGITGDYFRLSPKWLSLRSIFLVSGSELSMFLVIAWDSFECCMISGRHPDIVLKLITTNISVTLTWINQPLSYWY